MARGLTLSIGAALSLALGAAALAQNDGLITTAPRAEVAKPGLSKKTEDILGSVAKPAEVKTDGYDWSAVLNPTSGKAAPKATNESTFVAPKLTAAPVKAAQLEKAPPTTVGGATKAAPLCVRDNALVACEAEPAPATVVRGR